MHLIVHLTYQMFLGRMQMFKVRIQMHLHLLTSLLVYIGVEEPDSR